MWLANLALRSGLFLQGLMAMIGAWLVKHEKKVVPVFLGVVLTLLVLSILNRPKPADPAQVDLAAYEARVTAAQQYGDSMARMVKVTQKQVTKLERDVARLKDQIPDAATTDSMRAEADSLFAVLSDSVTGAYRIIPIQRAIIFRQDTTIKYQARVIAKQDTALVKQDTIIAAQALTIDSVRSVLRTRPEPPKPVKLLGIMPAPTRKQSATIGAFFGAIFAAWVLK